MADKLRKYKSLYSSTCNTFSTGEGVTITPASVTGLPTDTEITLTFDRVDSSGTKTPSKMERIRGTVTGGNFVISSGGRAVEGTEQVHTSPVVEMIWNADDWNDTVDWGLVAHNQDGTHKSGSVLTSPLFQGSVDGWISANETWTYVSVDDPTGVIKVNADVTSKYSVGMRLKMTNNSNVIYGIITKMGTYGGDSAGYTYITFLHEIDPSDSLALHLMANSAITLNYYSTQKAPFGFPLQSDKWTYVNVSPIGQYFNGGTKDTWLNGDQQQITIPIGFWNICFQGHFKSADNQASQANSQITLSTSNNSESDHKFTAIQQGYGAYSMITSLAVLASTFSKQRQLSLTSKTTYYVNNYEYSDGMIAFGCSDVYIICVCAYL